MKRTVALLLGLWLGLASTARASCPTLNDEEAMTGGSKIEQDLTSSADESPASERKQLSGKGGQHKVWWDDYNDRWTAIMWDSDQQRYEFFYRSSGTTWTELNVPVHGASESGTAMYRRRFDTWYAACPGGGGTPILYVLSHEFDEQPTASGTGSQNPIYFLAYDVDAGYTLMFERLVAADQNVEVATMAWGPLDRIFVTWLAPTDDASKKGVVTVASTPYDTQCACSADAADCTFTETKEIASGITLDASGCDAAVTWDDIAVGFTTRTDKDDFPNQEAAFGVLWSHQDPTSSCNNSRFDFRYFVGGALDDDANWSTTETVYSGTKVGDDHISVVDWAGGATGEPQITAVVKTSKTTSSDPMTVLINKVANGRCFESVCIGGGTNEGGACSTDANCLGGISTYTIETVSGNPTRPAIAFDQVNSCLYYFATDTSSYSIVEKHTDFYPQNPTVSWSAENTLCDETNKLNNVSVPRVNDLVLASQAGSDIKLAMISASYEHSEDAGYYCVAHMCANSLPCD